MTRHPSHSAHVSPPRPRNRRAGWWARIADSIESRLWPLPLAMIVLAVILGIALPQLDVAVDASLPAGVDSAVFNGGADTARSVLSSIAGSLITATSLTFSLTVVALQLASSQASPRVLRLFARDRQVQWTLAAFLGTFAYSITVLRSVRSPDESGGEFVPRISVTVAFVLTLVSVVMLIFFLAHLAKQLRVETMMKEIHAETEASVRLMADRNAAVTAFAGDPQRPASVHDLVADDSGFLTGDDLPALVELAAAHGIVIEEARQVGDNVVAGSVLARWWATGGADAAPDEERIARDLHALYAIRYERTSVEDPRHGIQQIQDIALRALSPGVNDPTTAVNALGHLSAMLAQLVSVPRAPAAVAGPDGSLRVITLRSTAAADVAAALEPVQHYGGSDPSVAARLLQVVEELAQRTADPDVLQVLDRLLAALAEQQRADSADPVTAARLHDATTAARRALRAP